MWVMRLFLLLFALSAAAFAQFGADKQVIDVDREWAQATTKADAAALDKILHDELIYIHSNGEADTKAQFIDNLKSGKRQYLSIDLHHPRVRVFGNAAVITSHAKIQTSMAGKPGEPVMLAFLHTYVKDKGAWRLVAHQSTRLPK